jgi:hypothetical protein
MPAEETQEQGRKGAQDVKRWLEATMRFRLPYDVYTATQRTTLELLGGTLKRFDLKGEHYDELFQHPQDIYIEVKNVTTDSNLSSQWTDFVAHAYSATHLAWDRQQRDPEFGFMFAATHPWSPTKYWNATSPAEVRKACESRPTLMPEGSPADDRLRALSDRLFLWVVSRRQNDMTMGKHFRGIVMAQIEEEG